MTRFFSARVCGLLALVLFLGNPARSFSAAARIAPVASSPSPGAGAPVSAGDVPDASSGGHASLPRYYFGSYITVDEKGEARELKDQVQHDDFVEKIKKWGIPQTRILEKDPGNCLISNPCEELSMREETSGIEVSLVTEIRQNPVISSGIPHTPLSNQTSMKDRWSVTRSCLSQKASWLLWSHDKQHQTSH